MLWIIASFVAFYIKGLCGFANTLVFTSIMGYGANNVNISPVELLLGYPANLALVIKNRRELKAKIFIPLALLVILGSIPGAFLLKNVNAGYIKVVFGVVVILIAIEMFLRDISKKKAKESKIILGIIGIISGVLCGLFGIGALLAAYVGRVTTSGDEFKANISIVFFMENTFRICLYIAMGVITLSSLTTAAFLLPSMFLGLYAGVRSSEILNDDVVKKLVNLLLVISGIVLIAKNI